MKISVISTCLLLPSFLILEEFFIKLLPSAAPNWSLLLSPHSNPQLYCITSVKRHIEKEMLLIYLKNKEA